MNYGIDDNRITVEILKELGFVKSDVVQFWERTANYYILRISDLTWVKYNLTDGFVTLMNKRESRPNRHRLTLLKQRNEITEIILPIPFRCEEDLRKLLELTSWEYRPTWSLNYHPSTPPEFR